MTRTPWKRREIEASDKRWLSVGACAITLLIVWAPVVYETTKVLGCSPAQTWHSICRW